MAARLQARAALDHGPEGAEAFDAPHKRKAASILVAAAPTVSFLHPSERSERVLSLGEAAVRLRVTRPELEAMIAAGKIEALPTGFARTIPTREVERMSRSR